jgi:sulfonate transport system permease protein
MSRRIFRLVLEIWLPITIVSAWWFFSRNSTSFFFPPLSHIVDALREQWFFAHFRSDLLPSLARFAGGLAIATVVGVTVGLALGLYSPARRATAPVVDFLRSIPAPALISVMILLLGFGNTMKVTAIAFASFFPILLNTIDGVRGVEPLQLDMAHVYRITRWKRVTRIVLPAATPQIFAGLRVSLAVALLVMTFSEMFASTNGLGFFIVFAQETYRIPDMWSGIIILGLVGYSVNLVFVAVEHRALAWHRGWRASTRDEGGLA